MLAALGVREGVPLAAFTSWRVGGPARYYVEPGSIAELEAALAWARDGGIPHFVLGKGSNLLIADAGYEGLVIRMGDRMGAVSVADDLLTAEAGCPTSALVRAGAEHGRGGLEFLTTIPGTVGGVVFMNAGAHGAEVSGVLDSALVLLPDGRLASESGTDLGYRYRHSNLESRGAIVVAATFRTLPKPKAEIQAEVAALSKWRRERQPQALSAGSVFTNPPGTAAGRLIEEAGCKGLTVGRAQVSPLHANFFVNLGGATETEINALICEVQRRVHAHHGLWLHPEVRGVGCHVGLEVFPS